MECSCSLSKDHPNKATFMFCIFTQRSKRFLSIGFYALLHSPQKICDNYHSDEEQTLKAKIAFILSVLDCSKFVLALFRIFRIFQLFDASVISAGKDWQS